MFFKMIWVWVFTSLTCKHSLGSKPAIGFAASCSRVLPADWSHWVTHSSGLINGLFLMVSLALHKPTCPLPVALWFPVSLASKFFLISYFFLSLSLSLMSHLPSSLAALLQLPASVKASITLPPIRGGLSRIRRLTLSFPGGFLVELVRWCNRLFICRALAIHGVATISLLLSHVCPPLSSVACPGSRARAPGSPTWQASL